MPAKTELTARERLAAVTRFEPVDRPPFLCPGGMMNMAVTDAMDESGVEWPDAHGDAHAMAALTRVAANVTGIENLGLPFCMTVEAEGLGAPVFFGTRETEPRVAEYVMTDLGETDRVHAFDAHSGRALVVADAVRELAAERERTADALPVIVCLTGPVSLATSLIEPLTFYRAMRRDRERAHRLLEISTEAVLAFGDVLITAGADAVCIADPSATGELLGRKAFDEFAAPYLNDLTRHFAERDTPTIVHVCGDVTSLGTTLDELAAPVVSVDSLVKIGSATTLAPSKAVMGNVSTYLLEYGKAETVAASAVNAHRQGAAIVAPACGIGARTPARNLKAAAEAVRTLGR
jgi:[methyl-Co(III) methanol-specific corrinoid protein]:coenzyme M methyltransferase